MHSKIDYGLVHELECIFVLWKENVFFPFCVIEQLNYIRLYPIILYQNVSIKNIQIIYIFYLYVFIYISMGNFIGLPFRNFMKVPHILKPYKYFSILKSDFLFQYLCILNIKSNTMGYLFVPMYIGIQLIGTTDIICNYFLCLLHLKNVLVPYKRIFYWKCMILNLWFWPDHSIYNHVPKF